MGHVRRRGACRSVIAVLVASSFAAGLAVPAGASSITDTKRLIAQLSSRLAEEERISEITSNEYDAAKTTLASLTASIAQLRVKESAKRVELTTTAGRLAKAVVRAYVLGIAETQDLYLFDHTASSAEASDVYQQRVVGDLTTLRNRYATQKASLDATILQVAHRQAQAEAQTQHISYLLAQNAHNESVTRATLAVVTVRLRNQIISYAIATGVAAAKRHDVAGEERAVASASAVGGQAAANQVLEAIQRAVPATVHGTPAGSAQGMAAVAAAKRQIGVPYVWGGETPGRGFDCSGLVQWAWGQAGYSIPRTTQSQYPALTPVPLNALQPGDLLFYYNLDGDHQVDHVVMYVGSGPWGTSTIISAAHSGTTVSLAPLFTFGLVGARRPAK
jgi:cell wall-associated NlpC family hydrolase